MRPLTPDAVNATELLTQPRQGSHYVQFYSDEGSLVDAAGRFLGAGLDAGEPVLVIATPEHREVFRRHLDGRGREPLMLDAEETLAQFMVGDQPDAARFELTLGSLLSRLHEQEGGPIRAYGEMVDVLWRQGNRRAAIQLEELWNELGRKHHFSLLCAYAFGNFYKESDRADLGQVCGAHSHVIPCESLQAEVEQRRLLEQALRDALADRARVEAERLQQSDQRVRLLIDSIQDYAIFMLEPDGTVASWNPGAQRIKGYSADEIIGRHFSTFYPQDDIAAGKCERELEGAARTGRFEDEGWRLRKDGTRFWANVIISAVRDPAGKLVGFAKVTRDLTERVRAEEDRLARAAAEKASLAKDDFLAMLGHELRNPLAPIMTAIQLVRLRGHDLRELDVIERQSQQLVRLVDDLLDVARITRGRVELRRQRVEIAEIVAQAIETVEPLLDQRHQRLTIEVPPRGCVVLGDRARLVQVVANLLNNAAKYTPPQGQITISAQPADGWVRLRVKDDGNGIAPEMLDRIFAAFVQQAQPVERGVGGLGLGLAIVRTLVDLHGGTVVARSDGLGKGSEFDVNLPLEASVDETTSVPVRPARAARAAGESRRVLVVDDNVDAAAVLAEVIAEMGHLVEVAHDGPSALRVAAELRPEIALLDIGLPVMDGYELATRLRAEPWAEKLRMVALTGYGQASHVERSRAAGFAEHLVKPIDLSAIERLLELPA